MKKIFSLSIFLLLVSIVPVQAYTKTDHAAISGAMTNNQMKMMKDQRQEAKMEKRTGTLQERADREITRRITSLQKLLDRLKNLEQVQPNQKGVFITQIQTEIDSLTALQAKIKGDTDVVRFNNNVQSLILSYKIYALFMAKFTMLAMADRMGATIDQFTSLATKLQARIDQEKAEGKDVTNLEEALSNLQKRIADAKTQEQSVITSVTPLTPDAYPENKSILQEAREKLRIGREQLIDARKDVRKIFQELGLPVKEPTPTVTTTPL